MNYNTLCLKLSSCLHSSTLTSSLHRSLYLSVCISSSCLPAASSSFSLSPLGFFFVIHFPPPLLLDPSLFLFTPPFILSPSISIYISPFHSLSALSSWPPLFLFTPSVLASPPPLPPSLLHLISDTLTWLSPLLPQEAGEPLFPLIPANAICKH